MKHNIPTSKFKLSRQMCNIKLNEIAILQDQTLELFYLKYNMKI